MFKIFLLKLKYWAREALKEENTWMWSLFAIFALLFTALLLLLNFF